MSNGSLHDRQTITLDAGNPVSASDDAGTVAIHTHGCKLNQADSSILARQFRRAGYRVVEDVRDADIYVLNTCTVTSTADSKARQALRAARRINPDAIVVAAGCYPQRAAGELEQMPAVNLVVGNAEKAKLASLAIAAHRERIGADSGYLDGDYERLDDYSASGLLPGRTRGMVKIQEGCDQVCSYCIVPRVRGRERSIPPEQIVRQIRRSVDEGCQEAVLTGTQLGTYGFDIPGVSLISLVRLILGQTNVGRLRISSLQPQELGEDLLRLWLEDCRLCPHFHVPLQSGSDTILKAMRRRYTTGRFAETVQMVRSLVPDSGITTDLIVGFPGEGPREFEESLAFASEMEFSDLHAFPYSRRPGTSAVYLEDHVPEPVKRERMQQVLELAHNSFISFRTNLLGSTRPVLWEGQEGVGGSQRGLTDNYVRVEREVDEQGEQFSGLTNKVTQARLVELQGKQVKARPLP
jgi:threonylcarbamoyladenosine tRNA methylthiotransferase MtaB